MISFRANGKLLLTSEYVILNGAKAIAVPTKLGQTLDYLKGDENLQWTALNSDGEKWITGEVEKSKNLLNVKRLITEAMKIAGLSKFPKGKVITKLEFSKDWGLGSSSTLTSLIAQWFSIDPMELHFQTSQGSGYDVACAQASQPIFYQKLDKVYFKEYIELKWPKKSIYFLYLGKKKRSHEAIKSYLPNPKNNIKDFTDLTDKLYEARTTESLIRLINIHENLMGIHLGEKSLPNEIFYDKNIGAKSLGAWGGDFGMFIIRNQKQVDYLKKKNPNTFFSWDEIIL